jgi:transposase
MSYKARLAGVPVEKVPAAYTSQGCHACGRINRRDKHAYRCERCGRQAHADANAAMNIRDWESLWCPPVLEAPAGGPYDPALKRVSQLPRPKGRGLSLY